VQTVDTTVIDTLERIATAQVVMAVAMAVVALIVVGGAIVVMLQLRSAHRAVQRLVDELQPRLVPLADQARRLSDDVTGMSGDVRRRVDTLLHTIEDLNRAIQRGGAAAEERLRRFDAVLDVVQTETEELLLDAAATAHGVQETARVLREPPQRTRSAPAVARQAHEEREGGLNEGS
jgi:methyl-accepting chemotaxis protein